MTDVQQIMKKKNIKWIENNSSNTSIFSHKMVLSKTENQIGLITFGCVSGTDSMIFNSNDPKHKSRNHW